MNNKDKLQVQRKTPWSGITYILDAQGILGTLKLSFLRKSVFYSGKDLYFFRPIDFIGNSFRVYKDSKSIGYIHFHPFRNLAQINLLTEGPYQFSTQGIVTGNWILRQGGKTLQRIGTDLRLYQIASTEKELLVACGLFTAAKINKDLIMFVPVVVFIWLFYNLS